jgi:flagellar motor switch protein FliG
VSPAPQAKVTGARKAAVLLVLLGDEASTEICKHLGKDELRLLAQEISDLEDISVEMATEVLQEYQGMSASPGSIAQGGPEYATKLVVQALGDEGSRHLVEKVIRAKETSAHNLAALEKADPKQLAKFLQDEHPQTIALILANLSTNVAKTVLMLMPEEIRMATIRRLAQTQNFSPEIVNKICAMLQRKLQTVGEPDRRTYGGLRAVAELLNKLDGKVTAGILEGIEKDNGELATSIRDQMFTFEDLTEVLDAGLRELLSHVDKKVLATALSGASDKLKERIYGCMSSRAVEMLKEDAEAMGALRSKDIKAAQTEMIAAARKLESEGKMTLRNTEEEEANVS